MMTPHNSKQYRKNVACFVINNHGQILVCKRADSHGTWQLPQGGIEKGESILDTAYRELSEEIGTNDVELIGMLDNSIFYDWPPEKKIDGFLGQEQHYVLFRIKNNAVLNLNTYEPAEFCETSWVYADEFRELVSCFKKEAYKIALEQLQEKFPDIIPNNEINRKA